MIVKGRDKRPRSWSLWRIGAKKKCVATVMHESQEFITMSRIIRIILLFILAFECTTASAQLTGDWAIPANKENFHVFLLMGQSNMAGFAPLQPGDDAEAPGVLTLRGELTGINSTTLIDPIEWERASHNLHQVQSSDRFGLGMDFAKRYMELNPGVTVGLIPAAWGASFIHNSSKGANRYANAIQRAQFAQQSGEIHGVLWHQGEGDFTQLSLANSYAANLDKLVGDLRTDLGDSDLPFVAGGLSTEYLTHIFEPERAGALNQFPDLPRAYPVVTAALGNLPNRVANTAFANPAGGGPNDPGYGSLQAGAVDAFGNIVTHGLQADSAGKAYIHFTHDSYIGLSHRYAEAINDLTFNGPDHPVPLFLSGSNGGIVSVSDPGSFGPFGAGTLQASPNLIADATNTAYVAPSGFDAPDSTWASQADGESVGDTFEILLDQNYDLTEFHL